MNLHGNGTSYEPAWQWPLGLITYVQSNLKIVMLLLIICNKKFYDAYTNGSEQLLILISL